MYNINKKIQIKNYIYKEGIYNEATILSYPKNFVHDE